MDVRATMTQKIPPRLSFPFIYLFVIKESDNATHGILLKLVALVNGLNERLQCAEAALQVVKSRGEDKLFFGTAKHLGEGEAVEATQPGRER